jgi:hypothetical protein
MTVVATVVVTVVVTVVATVVVTAVTVFTVMTMMTLHGAQVHTKSFNRHLFCFYGDSGNSGHSSGDMHIVRCPCACG